MNPRIRRIGWLVSGLFALLVVFLVYSTLTMGQTRCEVTMEMAGRQATVTAQGVTEADAIRAAITGACARIADGRTANILCLDTPPRAVRCD
ncbi:MAG: hypothetical protein OXI65_03200 [Acidobacteriota bacterium]|nr:hypothetical protein [Acidobacteriota bacterium]